MRSRGGTKPILQFFFRDCPDKLRWFRRKEAESTAFRISAVDITCFFPRFRFEPVRIKHVDRPWTHHFYVIFPQGFPGPLYIAPVYKQKGLFGAILE